MGDFYQAPLDDSFILPESFGQGTEARTQQGNEQKTNHGCTRLDQMGDAKPVTRLSTGNSCIDYVYGETESLNQKGLPLGMYSLIGGEKGVGKSRLVTAIVRELNREGRRTLYNHSEVSQGQLLQWAGNIVHKELFFATDTRDANTLFHQIRQVRPWLTVVDSVNMFDNINRPSQCRAIFDAFQKAVVETGGHIILLAHLNKTGQTRGLGDLEYLPDVIGRLQRFPSKDLADKFYDSFMNLLLPYGAGRMGETVIGRQAGFRREIKGAIVDSLPTYFKPYVLFETTKNRTCETRFATLRHTSQGLVGDNVSLEKIAHAMTQDVLTPIFQSHVTALGQQMEMQQTLRSQAQAQAQAEQTRSMSFSDGLTLGALGGIIAAIFNPKK